MSVESGLGLLGMPLAAFRMVLKFVVPVELLLRLYLS
jgi:hypothetical protein